MGYLSWLSSKKLLTQEEIRRKLFSLKTLTERERAAIREALKAFQGGGGVSSYELKRALDRLRGEFLISEIDRRHVIEVFFGQEEKS